MRLTSLILLLFSVNVTASSKNTINNPSELFLVGGGLKSCSTMSKSQCNSGHNLSNSTNEIAKTQALYRLDHTARDRVDRLIPTHYSAKHGTQIKKLLTKALKESNKKRMSKRALIDYLRQFDNTNLINKLSDPEYYLLLDALEVHQQSPINNERLKETVWLDRSKNSFTTQVYREFVERAKFLSGKEKPNVLVVTASARDSFEAVDFYVQAFEQAGAIAQWLPIDATLQSILNNQSRSNPRLCDQLAETRIDVQKSAYRESIYPDLTAKQHAACLDPQLMLNQVTQADGIFINGGDQSLTKQAFIKPNGEDTALMATIRAKFNDGNFIIGGTSAGTAVMSGGVFNKHPVPMITSGQSDRAIFHGAHANVVPTEGCQKANNCDAVPNDQLTYSSSGGLGLFSVGILDTHFSERGRQGRLAVLARHTMSRLAFGVDERTALVVRQLNNHHFELSVIGQSGVFIVEDKLSANVEKPSQLDVITHYIHQGDKVNVSPTGTLSFEFSKDKQRSKHVSGKLPVVANIFDKEKYITATKLLCLSEEKSITGTVTYDGQHADTKIMKNSESNSMQGLYLIGKNKKHDCSYQNYQLEISVK